MIGSQQLLHLSWNVDACKFSLASSVQISNWGNISILFSSVFLSVILMNCLFLTNRSILNLIFTVFFLVNFGIFLSFSRCISSMCPRRLLAPAGRPRQISLAGSSRPARPLCFRGRGLYLASFLFVSAQVLGSRV